MPDKDVSANSFVGFRLGLLIFEMRRGPLRNLRQLSASVKWVSERVDTRMHREMRRRLQPTLNRSRVTGHLLCRRSGVSDEVRRSEDAKPFCLLEEVGQERVF